MKHLFYTILALTTVAIFGCKKSDTRSITEYDDDQIQEYIRKNNLTMQKADSGIYYQVIKAPTGTPLDYPDKIYFTYSMRSLDGKYLNVDTNANRTSAFLGYITPAGLRKGIKDLLGARNGTIRIIIPSKQGYGTAGYGKIPGNASIDYIVNVYGASNQLEYDTLSIRDFIKENNLSGFTKTASGVYYKVLEPGTGDSTLTTASTMKVAYTGKLLDGSQFDSSTEESPLESQLSLLIAGWREAMPLSQIKKGGKIRMFIPSNSGYGSTAKPGIPANSVLDFEVKLISFTE
jgi:FKBP-type peptidyl-prolyl cis-trans isomerase FkpA